MMTKTHNLWTQKHYHESLIIKVDALAAINKAFCSREDVTHPEIFHKLDNGAAADLVATPDI